MFQLNAEKSKAKYKSLLYIAKGKKEKNKNNKQLKTNKCYQKIDRKKECSG